MYPMTPEQIAALAMRAYRDLGYQVVTWRDGTKGVVNCPTKTIKLMNRFQELIFYALEKLEQEREAHSKEDDHDDLG